MINRNYINHIIEHSFGSRITRNIIFWIFFGSLYFLNYFTSEGATFLSNLTLFQLAIIFFSRILVYGPMVYFNNLVLLPFLLEKKKYILYLISVCILIIAGIYYVQFTIDWFTSYLPETQDQVHKNIPATAFLFATTVIILGFTMSKYSTDYFTKKQNEEKLQKENLISELDLLKSQINPHFLFNALNTIYGLSITNSSLTSDSIMQLSDILRYNLYECNAEKVSLAQELKYIENYLEFAKLRRNKNARIEFSKEGNYSNLNIAPLLFIPFIENSFKHGLDKSIDNGWINIKLKVDVQYITFVCGNSKPPTNNSKSKINSGIGLQNVKRRLDLVYGEKYQLSIKEDDTYYSTILKIEI